MKILSPGNRHWQFTVTNRCRNCGAKYVLEKDDRFEEAGSGATHHIRSLCPTCGTWVETDNPHQHQPGPGTMTTDLWSDVFRAKDKIVYQPEGGLGRKET